MDTKKNILRKVRENIMAGDGYDYMNAYYIIKTVNLVVVMYTYFVSKETKELKNSVYSANNTKKILSTDFCESERMKR